jgi:hypothetical protein
VVVQPPIVVKKGAVLTIIEHNINHVRVSRHLPAAAAAAAAGTAYNSQAWFEMRES